MRKSVLVILCITALACQKTETAAPDPAKPNVRTTTTGGPTDAGNLRVDTVVQPVPAYFETAMVSTTIDAQGHAKTDDLSIPKGSVAHFTMRIKESPVGLHTRAVWMDADRKEIAREERDMQGAKVATFKLDTAKVKPGRYIVQGYWGGNFAVEKEFDIAAAAAQPAKTSKSPKKQ